MDKYTKKELAELAKGVFNDDKGSPAIYADESGTFRNSAQYDAMSAEEKEKFPFKFDSPHHAIIASDEKEKGLMVQVKTLKAELAEANEELASLAKELNAARIIIIDGTTYSKDQLAGLFQSLNEVIRDHVQTIESIKLEAANAAKTLQDEIDDLKEQLKAKVEADDNEAETALKVNEEKIESAEPGKPAKGNSSKSKGSTKTA